MRSPMSLSPLARSVRAALFGAAMYASCAQAAPPLIELADLDGRNGLRLDGAAGGDRTGRMVARAGDVNGDGIDDLIVGAPRASPGGLAGAGAAYVVFGTAAGQPPARSLANLDGRNGFRIGGANAGERFGTAVAAAGDINGDGIDDLIVGASEAGASLEGAAYVVFGRNGVFPASLSASQLDGSQGFRLHGANAVAGLGTAVLGAGDLDGDGRDDLVVGAPGLEDASGAKAGGVFVLYGRAQFPASVNLGALAPGEGMRIEGVATDDAAGEALASGDVNGDGLADLLIGASGADPRGRPEAGSSYVVFGRANAPSLLELSALDGANGFRIDGVAQEDFSGIGLAALDIDGDAIDDIVVGSVYADPNGLLDAGTVHLLRGQAGNRPPALDLADAGTAATRLDGEVSGGVAGLAVAHAGDVDGDGCADLLIGAPGAGDTRGRAYVLLGCAPLPASLSLGALDGDNGFALQGVDIGGYAGVAVASAGDFNDDGVGDVLVGAHFTSSQGLVENGAAFLVYGGEPFVFANGFEEEGGTRTGH